jgi:hypothetical protein
MAILEKRKSVNQLPRFERYQDTRGGDRAAALRGETPITSAVRQLAGTSGYGSMADKGFLPMGGRTSPAITSAIKGAPVGKVVANTAANAVSKTPSITSKPAGTAGLTSTGSGAAKTTGTTGTTGAGKTLTSTGSGTAKTTGTTTGAKTTGTNTGSSLGKTITNALAGAAVGVGAKTVLDKLTGGTKTTGTGTTGTKTTGTGTTGTGTTSVVKGTGTTGTKTTGTTGTNTGGTGVTSVVKGTGTTTGTKGNTVNVGGTNTGTGPRTPVGTGAKTTTGTGGTRGIAGTSGVATGAATTGTDTTDTTLEHGVAYDDEGNLMPGYELDEEGNPVWVGDSTDTSGDTNTAVVTDTVDNNDGTQTVTYDDGSTVTTDINGNVVASTDATDTGADTTGYFSDTDGNIYDAEGNLVQYADGSSVDENGNDGIYTDDYGNTYDANGDLIAEADHSDFTQQDEYGNTYDYDGNLISYADDYNPDDYSTDDTNVSYDDTYNDDSEVDFGAKGGLFNMAKGGMPHFNDGGVTYSDTTEEVQPFQNVDYNYGEFDDPTMTGDNSLYSASGKYSPNYVKSVSLPASHPVAENDNGDGTVTQFFDDGSSITYDTDGNVLDVTESTDTGAQTTVGASQAGAGNRQYFDDGSSIETFDDGSTVTYDADGNVYKSTDAYETTYDDEGNAIVTDGYGNIVSVYDPQGNVIPLGGGRITGPTSVTGSGGKTGVDLTPNKTPAQIAAENRQKKIDEGEQKSAIDKLLAGINTNTGAGVTGAVLGALLGNSDLFGGSSGQNNAGIDMSKVGVIKPRTTDFGIGPANYVGYDQYGTPEAMPELYGNELYQNLNAPGFNEVNPGDYARMDAEMEPQYQYYDQENTEVAPDDEQVEGMAEGGLPQGGLGASQTFYTFGKATDPMQNLYNPQPAQPQSPQAMSPQGMPPQAAQNQQQMAMSQPVQALPVGMPQGALQGQNMGMGKPPMAQQNPVQTGPQGLKSGGLPAWSNVPITAGRLNFRDGAPVHGAGDGQSDDIPAMLADGEYVIDAETVAQIGNGSTKAGAQALDKFRENIRAHKRSAPVHKIPPKTKALTSYLRGAK